MIGIRRKWIAPHDDYRVLRADGERNLLVFERVGAHRVRVLIHMGTSPVDVHEYTADGKILLQKGYRDSKLKYCGYVVLAGTTVYYNK